MPSFSFWKSSKAETKLDETNATSKDVAEAQDPTLPSPTSAIKLDLDPKNQDSGVFTFEDMELLAPATPLQKLMDRVRPSAALPSMEQVDADAPVLDDEDIQSRCSTPDVDTKHQDTPTHETNVPSHHPRGEPWPLKDEWSLKDAHTIQGGSTEPPSRPAPEVPVEEASPTQSSHCANGKDIPAPVRQAPPLPVQEAWPIRSTSIPPPSRPAPTLPTQDASPARPFSIFSRHTPSASISSVQQPDSTPRRLHRATELNLGNTTPSASRPPAELERQFSLMRNSTTQSKAALRSSNQLLEQRLSMSAKTKKQEDKTRVFVPPQLSRGKCLMPGPAGQIAAFSSTSVRAQTESGRPAWWCKTDKLVVFDGIDIQDSGDLKFCTRTSKGLSIARRRGDTETITIPMDCAHCQEMLNRHEWKYDMQVCKRSVCWDCKERCKWELEQEVKAQVERNVAEGEDNRERADSVLQDDGLEEEHLMQKVGMGQLRAKSPIEAIGGIEERMKG